MRKKYVQAEGERTALKISLHTGYGILMQIKVPKHTQHKLGRTIIGSAQRRQVKWKSSQHGWLTN